jgi:hypothetical protein
VGGETVRLPIHKEVGEASGFRQSKYDEMTAWDFPFEIPRPLEMAMHMLASALLPQTCSLFVTRTSRTQDEADFLFPGGVFTGQGSVEV